MPSKVEYHPLFRSIIRPTVLLLDRFKCQACGVVDYSNHVHHIDSSELQCKFDKMHTLCAQCHSLAHKSTYHFRFKQRRGLFISSALLGELEQDLSQ